MSYLIRLTLAFPLVALLTTVPASTTCADSPLPALDKTTAEQISFRRDVWPIMKRHCWGCHSGGDAQGGLSIDSLADMLRGGHSGPLFDVGEPDESLLLTMLVGSQPEMPKDQPPLSAAKIQILRQWVFAGAKDDSLSDDALAVRIPDEYQFAPPVTSVAFHPDGTTLAVACRSEVVLLAVDGGESRRRLATESDWLSHVEFNSDATLLAAVGGSPARYGEVRFLNAADGTLVSARRVGHDTLFRGNFAPDGKTIAVGGTDGAVHLIPADPEGDVRSFDLHSDWVLAVAYTPDGTMLVSGGRDMATKVSSVETGELLRSVDGSTQLISGVAADDQFVVAAGRARTLIGYELSTALRGIEVTGAGNGARPVTRRDQYVKNFESQPGEVLAVAASGDRKLIAVAGHYGDVRVYRIADRQRVAIVSNVPAPVYSLALSADGSQLAVGTKSGLAQVYEVATGGLLASFSPVPTVASPD